MSDESKQYNNICKSEFAELNTKLDKVLGKLYIDNGGESFQSRINRHDIWIKRATRVAIALAIAVLGLSVDAVQQLIRNIIH